MQYVLVFGLIALIVFGPSLWVKATLRKYRQPEDRYGFTGAYTARRLLDESGLEAVSVEETEPGKDHYDPSSKAVRLSPEHYTGRSLAAVTVAAHEVGHALQDAQGYRPLKMRTQLAAWVGPLQSLGVGLLMLTPVIAVVLRTPSTFGITLIGGLLTLGLGVLVHALTLPTEYDASFNRALPLLQQKGVLHDGDDRHARRILTAAAVTYVAGALMSLLNVARWLAILGRR